MSLWRRCSATIGDVCGFVGQFIITGDGRADLPQAQRISARLRHRGPDEEGSFISGDGRCAIGFRRLSVIDPAASHQPMSRKVGSAQVTIAFNGEIYNFCTLREELTAAGHVFTTRGDTEVLLAMYLQYGMAMLNRLEGMFAAAIYDGRDGKLHLFRDRLGVKPLWYGRAGASIIFASEAKGILGYDGVDRTIDPDAMLSYLSFGYVPAPRSIWRGIYKVPPGSYLTLPASELAPAVWWRPPCVLTPIGRQEAVDRVRQTVEEVVRERLVADVPIAALLSGGIDSSIVTALMCRSAGDGRAVKTFTAGFTDQVFDERPFARRVAEHLGTDHHELVIEEDAPSLLDTLVGQYDEPFGDSSALPLYLLCQAIRPQVTVALAGDGGDEAFGGYDRHRAMWLAQHMSAPKMLAATAAAMLVDSFAPADEKSPLRRFVRFARGLEAPPAIRYMGYRSLFSLEQLDELLTDNFAEQVAIAAPRDQFCEPV